MVIDSTPAIIVVIEDEGVFSYNPTDNSFTFSPDMVKNLDEKESKDLISLLVKMTTKIK